MAIARYTRRPFTPWTDLDDVNDLMSRFFTRPALAGSAPTEWMPAVNLVENADAFEATAELPGFTSENVEIEFENDVLTLRGQKSEERTEGDEKSRYHLWERRTGNFHRSFKLPGTVDAEHVSAAFVDGVLTIRLPKAAEAKGRKIQINPAIES